MRLALAAALALLIVGAAVALGTRSDPAPLAEASSVLDDEARFASARSAGEALLVVSDLLRVQGERCLADRSPKPASGSCDPFFAGAGHVQIVAALVTRCSRPAIFDVRTSMQGYLEELTAAPSTARLPETPRCD